MGYVFGVCSGCCGCSGCAKSPTLMRAKVKYPSAGGVTLFEDSENDPPSWLGVTTDCSVEQARRFVQRVRITNPGEGYTVAPMLAITGGGGTPSLDAWIEISSPVVEIAVTAAGSGYTSPPAVSFSGGGKVVAATAKSVIEGKLTSLTVTDPGIDYAEPPDVVVLGGEGAEVEAVMDGYVLSIAITDGGQGYTSAPSVTLSGGGGSGATGSVSFSKAAGVVTGGFVVSKGDGYTSPPEVILSGGGGTGAAAVAEIAFQVKSLTVVDGGDGYPHNPTVKFVGDASLSAAATAAIEGKVVAVNVINPGLYRHRRDASGAVLVDWPTVSIAGSATAEPKFSGKVTLIDPGDNKNYASVPDVTITTASGDVGTGATAVAELNWEQEHERTTENFMLCRPALLNEGTCYSTDQDPATNTGGSDCANAGEQFSWQVRSFLDIRDRSSGTVFRDVITTGAAAPDELAAAALSPFFFEGEGAVVNVSRGWAAASSDVGYDNILLSVLATEREIDWLVARRFSRVPPDVTYEISFPAQPNESENIVLTPEWTQYVDAKGDSFWYLESLAVTDAGENLFFPPASNLRIAAVGNAVHEARVFSFEFSRAAAAVAGDLVGFTTQPNVTITLTETGSPAGTFYRISDAQIASGGETEAEDGPVSVPVVLTQGHWNASPVVLAGVISGGQLTEITVPAPSEQILAGATLASISLDPDATGNEVGRITTGRSPFELTYEHSQPTVVARAIAVEGEQDAVFACTLAQQTDLNGDPFWEIESAIANTPGSGFGGVNPTFVFEPAPPGIMAVMPEAFPVLERIQPNMAANTLFGTGTGAVFNVNLVQKTGQFGDEYWEVERVDVVDGGSGYSNGSLTFSDQPTDGMENFFAEKQAFASYETSGGAIISVAVVDPGWFYGLTGGLRRLHFWNKGRFFIRDFNVSSDPLPVVSCIGPVSEEAGWDRNKLLFQIDPFFIPPRTITDERIDVGEEYYNWRPGLDSSVAFNLGITQRFHRARRCPLPEIELEFE